MSRGREFYALAHTRKIPLIKNILIVEDDAWIAADLDALLEDAGYTVVGFAADMTAALAIAAKAPVDVAIMDVKLASGASGLETALRLREQHDVASLFVTAQNSETLRSAAAPSRPIGFIDKPYAAGSIVTALKRAA